MDIGRGTNPRCTGSADRWSGSSRFRAGANSHLEPALL